MSTCVLLRHGRSSANAAGVLAGWMPDVHLDETGRADAAAAARALVDAAPVLVACSPLQRCRETARPLLDALPGLRRLEEVDLGECRYGAWTGRAIPELAQEPLWRAVQDDPASVTFPAHPEHETESIAAMADRTWAAVERIGRTVDETHGTDAVWVAVSHGDPIKSVLANAVGVGLTGFQRFHLDPGSLSAVTLGERPALLFANVTRSPVGDRLAHARRTDGPTVGGDTGGAPVTR